MKIYERLQSISRPIIYLLLLGLLSVPLLFPISLPLDISPATQSSYDAIEKLAPGSIIVVSTDWEASTQAESGPQTEAIVRHIFQRDLKLVVLGLWPQGNSATDSIVNRLASEYDKAYGTDWVNLGYKPGGEVVLASLAENIRTLYPQDSRGTPIDNLEICRDLTSAKDIALVISVSWGDPGHITWVKMVGTPHKVPVIAAVTAVSIAGCAPYVQSGQIVGVVGGLGGAAEYEKLVNSPGKATAGMGAQTAGHLLILLLVLVGNVGYIVSKRQSGKEE